MLKTYFRRPALLLIILIFFPIHAAHTTEADLKKFLEAMNDTTPVASAIGSTWSTPYLGQFMGVPLHFGLGAAVGMINMPLAPLQDIAKVVGASIGTSQLSTEKHWFPMYAVIGRVGGIWDLPIDVGFKFGMIDGMPSLYGDFLYKFTTYSVDIRWAFYRSEATDVTIYTAFEYASFTGGLSANASKAISDGTAKKNIDSGSEIMLKWECTIAKLKLFCGIPIGVSPFTLFAGLEAGGSMYTGGIDSLKGDRIYELGIDTATWILDAVMGLGLEIGTWVLDVGLILNLKTAELGYSLSFRYQQ